jgi:hypothetical protein
LGGLTDYKGKFGILAHAFTTDNFKKKFREFELASVKVGDSGIYQKKQITYLELFSEYEKMGVTHGIIKDYYKDPKRTFISAKEAIKVYLEGKNEGRYNFELVGVAQGDTVADYIESYMAQKELGFRMVAIGGLLYKIEKHTRMVRLSKNILLHNVLTSIRNLYPNDDLFPLGVFNKDRIKLFLELNIWGSDYKGWIFKYNISESHREGNRFEQVRSYLKSNIFEFIENNINFNFDKKNQLNQKIKYEKLNPNRLLILSCSKRKADKSGKAIKVYQGVAYNQLRNYYFKKNHLDVKIISAKYGLIDKNDIIDPYDNKMNVRSSEIYKIAFRKEFETLSKQYDDIFVFGGKNYQNVVSGFEKFQFTQGKIGEQLHQLKEWLYSHDLW